MRNQKPMRTWVLTLNPKLTLIPVFHPQLRVNRRLLIKPKLKLSNWYQRQLINLKITRMICSFKSLLPAETMQYIWALFTWDHLLVSQQELSSIQAQSTWPSPVRSVMIRLQETSSSKSMIHYQAHSYKETSWPKDAALRLMTCTSQTPIRSFLKLLQSWLTDQPSSKVSSGKTMLASNLSGRLQSPLLRSSSNLKTANVHISNF